MLSWLFLRRTDKQGWFRHLVNIFSVTLAFTLLLSGVSLGNASVNQNTRTRWVNNIAVTSHVKNPRLTKAEALKKTNLPQTAITYDSHKYSDKSTLIEVGLYKLSPNSPVLPGLDREPEEGEFFVSPALMDLINKNPIIKNRFAQAKITAINVDRLIAGPNSKIAFYKIPADKIEVNEYRWFDQNKLADMNKAPELSRGQIIVQAMMFMGGLGAAFPLFILMISATRIGILQRQERYSALSLVGASRRQINNIVLLETLLGSGVGLGLGYGLYLWLKSAVLVNFDTGSMQNYFLEDLTVSPMSLLLVIGLVILIIIVVNFLAIRKAKTSPLGVMRLAENSKKLSLLRFIPFLIVTGFWVWLRGFAVKPVEENSNNTIMAIGGFFCLAMVGLLLIGPWITFGFSKLLEKISNHSANLMAAKRLKVFSKSITGNVNGLVLAVFVGSFLITGLTIGSKTLRILKADRINLSGVADAMTNDRAISLSFDYNPKLESSIDPKPIIKNLLLTSPGLSSRVDKIVQAETLFAGSGEQVTSYSVFSCEDLAWRTQLSCPEGSAKTDLALVGTSNNPKIDKIVKPGDLEKQPEVTINQLIIKLKDQVDLFQSSDIINSRLAGFMRQNQLNYNLTVRQAALDFVDPIKDFKGLIDLVYFGTFVTILIGGLSLTIATIGGFFERQKSFTNLRLMGVEMATLNKAVLIESAIPILLQTVVALVSGIAFSYLTLSTIDPRTIFAMPEWQYFGLVGLAIIISLGIIYAILPILKQITSLEKNRSE